MGYLPVPLHFVYIQSDVSSFSTSLPKEAPYSLGRSSTAGESMLSATWDDFVNAQMSDPTPRACFSAVVTREWADVQPLAYFVGNGVLIRKWSSHQGPDIEWSTVVQVVVPTA